MTLAILFLSTIAAYFVMQAYAEDDRRFPPFSTRRGKEARIMALIVLLPLVATLTYRFFGDNAESHGTPYLVGFIFVALGVPLYRALRNNDKRN